MEPRSCGVLVLMLGLTACGSSTPTLEPGDLTQAYIDAIVAGDPGSARSLACRPEELEIPTGLLEPQVGEPSPLDANGVTVTAIPVTATRRVVGGENEVSFEVIEGDGALLRELDQAFNRAMTELGAPPIEIDPDSYPEDEDEPCIVGITNFDDGSLRPENE